MFFSALDYFLIDNTGLLKTCLQFKFLAIKKFDTGRNSEAVIDWLVWWSKSEND